MKIELKDNMIVLKELYNTILLETESGKKLYVCMRDGKFEISTDGKNWTMTHTAPHYIDAVEEINKILNEELNNAINAEDITHNNPNILTESNKETIEEFSQRIANTISTDTYYNPKIKDAIEIGFNWQAEQDKDKYNAEEVFRLTLDALDLGMTIRQDQLKGYSEKSGKELHKEWFYQIKK